MVHNKRKMDKLGTAGYAFFAAVTIIKENECRLIK